MKRFSFLVIAAFLVTTISHEAARGQNSIANHLVISEVQVGGTLADDEFVEIYNPTSSAISLSGWRLTRKTSTGTESILVSDFGAAASIAAHGFFLVAPPDVDYDGPTADKTYTNTTNRIAANNSVLLYSDAQVTLVDKVAWGTGNDPEGTATANPANNGSIERKASCSSSAASLGAGGVEENAGNGQDTNNNSADFVQQTISNPQNTSSSSENDAPLAGPSADAGADQKICLGESVQIGDSPTGGTAPYNFLWSPSAGLDDATAENPTASPASTTTYTVEVTDANGCKDSDEMTVTVNPLPTADAGPDQEICLGESVQIGDRPTGGTAPYTFVWSPSAGLDDATAENPIASPTSTTTYTVEVTDANGCKDSDEVTVTVNPSPTADAGPDQEINAGQSVQIGGSPTGGTPPYTFLWSPSAGLDGATAENPNASPASTTTYTVEVTDANGCKDTDAVTVTVQDDEPEPVHDVVLLADDGISLDRHGASEGNLHSNEDIDVDTGAPSTLKGNLTAVDDIRIEEDNTIGGDVTAGDGLQIDDGVTITGAPTGNASVSSIALPTLSFTTGGANQTVPQNGSLTLTPDSYGNVKVNKNGTLNLGSGDYFLRKLELKASATLAADVSNGPVKIHVETKLSFDKNAQVSVTPGGENNTAKVIFEFLGGAKVSIGEQARVLGNVIAPEAIVELRKNSRLKGSICAELIKVKEGAVFLHHSSSTPLPAKQNAPEDIEEIDNEEQITSLPTDYDLAPNYPNPFNPSTTIEFAMPEAGTVILRVYSITGQLVRTLASGSYASGKYSLAWDAKDGSGSPVATGIYFYQLVVQKQKGEIAFMETRRMTLIK